MEETDYKFETYMTGSVAFTVTEAIINKIRVDRGIPYQADIRELEPQTLDLALADLYMAGTLIPASSQGASDSDGGWSHTSEKVTMTASDKSFLNSAAQKIYKKYNDSKYKPTIKIIML